MPLSSDKMAAIWAGNNTVVKIRSYNGISTWNPIVQSTSEAYYGEELSVTASRNTVNIAYTCGHSICFNQYNYKGNSLSPDRIIASTDYDPIPNLVQDGNLVYLFWGNVTPPTFYYMDKAGNTWTHQQSWFVGFGENYSTNRAWLFTTPTANSENQIGMIYATGDVSPYDIQFALLNVEI